MAVYLTLTPDKIESFQKIIHSGMRGIHVLFDNSVIRCALSKDSPVSLVPEEQDRVENVVKKLLNLPNVLDQRDFIMSLDPEIRDALVQLYFVALDQFGQPANQAGVPLQ